MKVSEEIKRKRDILRELYGGYMSATDLSRELAMNRMNAKQWGIAEGLGIRLGGRIKFETDMVAKRLVEMRGMC